MTAAIVTVLLLVIGGFIVFAIAIQIREQARLNKLRKATALNNQLRQVRRYLDDMPPQYQPKDMRLFLFSRLVALYEELHNLQSDPSVARRRNHAKQEMEEFQNSKKRRKAKPMSDENFIIGVKRVFESFRSFLISSQRQKHVKPEIVARYNKLLDFFGYKVNSDHAVFLGRQAYLSGRMEIAAEKYKEAISVLDPIKDSEEAQPLIDKYKEILKDIEEGLALQTLEENMAREEEEKNKENAPKEEPALNDEWSKFIDDGTFKEKKRF